MNKIKGLDNWVESYNQPPDTTRYIMKTKPKYVYAAIIMTIDNKMQIVGCFYEKEAAERYAGNSSSIIIQKLSVI